MQYKNTIPAAVYGTARKATHTAYPGAEPKPTTDPKEFTWNEKAGTYEQGGDRNKSLPISALVQCAGRLPGLYESDGKQICVDSPLICMEPAAGEFKLIDALLENFTTTPDEAESAEQKAALLAWLRTAAKAVMQSEAASVPVLVLRPQEPEQAEHAAFIVSSIIKPLLGNLQADLAPYLYPQGHQLHHALTAQSEAAALFFAYLPQGSCDSRGQAYHTHDLLEKMTSARTFPERVHMHSYTANSQQQLQPIFCPVIVTTTGAPYISDTTHGKQVPAVMLHVNKATINRSAKSMNALAADCQEQLPALLHHLLTELPDAEPASYISPSFAREEQKAALQVASKNHPHERAFYKLATLLILATTGTPCEVYNAADILELYKTASAIAKELKMPYPCPDWMPDKLKACLTHCAKLYPAYITDKQAEGWTINLPALARDIMPF